MTDPRSRGAPLPPRSVTLLLVIVAVVWRIWSATHGWGLGQDACTFLETARGLRDGTIGRDWWPFRMRHPAYPILIAGGGVLGADLELTARVISIAASAALVAVVHRTWSAWRGPGEGALAALLFAIHPGLALYGGEIWVEPVQMLAAFVALRGCTGLWDAPTDAALAARSAGLGALFGVLACFKNNAVFFVPGAAIALCLPRTAGFTIRRCGVALAAFLATFVPTALAPQILEYCVRGTVTPILPKGHVDPRLLDPEDSWIGRVPDAPGRLGALVRSNAHRLVTQTGPRMFFPWWLTVPFASLGVRSLRRGAGAGRRYLWIAGASICVECAVMLLYGIQDRYLLFGHLALLPAVAAGFTEARRLVAARPVAIRWIPALAVVALAAVWTRSFWLTTDANARAPNGYRDAGVALSSLPPSARPHRILTTTGETAWRAGAEHQTFGAFTWAQVQSEMALDRCDGLVVGDREISICPELREAADAALGSVWRGLRVLVRIEGPERVLVLGK